MSNSYGPPGHFGPPPGPPPGPPGPPGPYGGTPYPTVPPNGGGPYGPYGPPGPPRPPRRSSGGTAAVVILCCFLGLSLIGGLAFAFFQGWLGTKSRERPPSVSAPSHDGTSGGNGDTSGPGGSDTYTRPTPTPDPTASAFRRVTAGSCLTVYDTGRGGNTVAWNTDMPPAPVSCDSKHAMVQVDRVTSSTGGCKTGIGHAYWYHRAAGDAETTVLCLTRIYRENYCLLGKQTGGGSAPRISLGPMTAVDCTDKKVPAAYNQIMHITGVYQAPPGATANNCARVQGDQTRYWAWKVNDGKTLLCTMIFQPR